jgi:hypothetical protein
MSKQKVHIRKYTRNSWLKLRVNDKYDRYKSQHQRLAVGLVEVQIIIEVVEQGPNHGELNE